MSDDMNKRYGQKLGIEKKSEGGLLRGNKEQSRVGW
jgi:hypothetical protein